MKYGEQLEKDSVPEWSLHNLDYNTLKHEIKVHTTRSQARAVAIPGSPDLALFRFEETLYRELCGQHDRVGLFVTSKYHEILRRMEHMAGSIRRWVSKYDNAAGHGRNTLHIHDSTSVNPSQSQAGDQEASARFLLKKHRKYIKYEKELLRMGDEIHDLQRFSNAQVVAFRKILKKYKKWTGSTSLGARFSENFLQDPKSFTRQDFSPLQQRHSDLMAELRAASPNLEQLPPGSSSSSEGRLGDDTLRSHPSRHSSRPRVSIADSDTTITAAQPAQMAKYWNEYDDGSDAGGGGPDDEYAIYIDPDGGNIFPSMSSVRAAIALPWDKMKQLFRRDTFSYDESEPDPEFGSGLDGATTDERRRLLGSRDSTFDYSSTAINTDSEEEGYSSSDRLPSVGYRAHYTLPSLDEQRRVRYRERVLFMGTIFSFVASFLFLGISSILISTGRHKLRVEVDAVATLGIVVSLFCACGGLAMTMYRHDKLSWSKCLMLWSSFVASCLLNGMLLVLVVGNAP